MLEQHSFASGNVVTTTNEDQFQLAAGLYEGIQAGVVTFVVQTHGSLPDLLASQCFDVHKKSCKDLPPEVSCGGDRSIVGCNK